MSLTALNVLPFQRPDQHVYVRMHFISLFNVALKFYEAIDAASNFDEFEWKNLRYAKEGAKNDVWQNFTPTCERNISQWQ